MAMPTGYKPSPLGLGSPRSSPFRRPESPSSPSTVRQTTPTGSPSKVADRVASFQTPSRLANATTAPSGSPEARRPRGNAYGDDMAPHHLGSPAHVSRTQSQPASGNALSQLQPTQVRVLRDGFQILDRDSDGVVNREDVADMLNQLGEYTSPARCFPMGKPGLIPDTGLPSSPSDISQLFPPGGTQTMTLAAFLNSIATTLADMSPSAELLSAFSAFDDDDSGQVDLNELRDALLHTAPEPGERALSALEVDKIMVGFSGRRAFSRGTMSSVHVKKGEVFKYQEFVKSIVGGNGNSEPSSQEGSEG